MRQAVLEDPDQVRRQESPLPALPDRLLAAAQEIIAHAAFDRLRNVTFLGALSPRFRLKLDPPPILLKRFSSSVFLNADGTRADHSIAVSEYAFLMAEQFNLSVEAQRYAVAWGLFHDIATWGLSHTGEAAFADVTGVSSRTLRAMMIHGDPILPECFNLKKLLKCIGISGETLLSLFSKKPSKIAPGSNSEPKDFGLLWLATHSPLNPDTLEGICRCGLSFNVNVPPPNAVMRAFTNTLLGPVIGSEYSEYGLSFWRCKSNIYRTIINNSSVVQWESNKSRDLRLKYASISLGESLELPEDALVHCISQNNSDNFDAVFRYKVPRKYWLGRTFARKKKLGGDLQVDDLYSVFRSEPF